MNFSLGGKKLLTLKGYTLLQYAHDSVVLVNVKVLSMYVQYGKERA